MSAWALMSLPQVVHHTQITKTFLSSTRKEIHFCSSGGQIVKKCSITRITMDKREQPQLKRHVSFHQVAIDAVIANTEHCQKPAEHV